MNRRSCEREYQTSAAMINGVIDPETLAHAQHCPDCADTLLVGEFLRNDSTLADQEWIALPNPELIWQEAHRRATDHAVRVASRPIRWMTVLACVAFACSPWLRLVLPAFQDLAASSTRFLGSNLASYSRILPATSNDAMILLGLSGTTILLGLSSWLMLREE